MQLYLHLYLYLCLYPSTATLRLLPRHPGALPPPSAQLLQLPFCSVISGTGSLSNPLSPEAEKCHPEKAAQSSIAVVALPLSLHEHWQKPPVRNEARIYRLALDAMQSTLHLRRHW